MESGQIVRLIELAFELAGVAALVIGSIIALARFLIVVARGQASADSFSELRRGIGRAILLGLEFLVAADIIRSVAIQPTFESVGVLALIVLVRTFLSWSLAVEITGEWPWRRAQHASAKDGSQDVGEI